jgi:BlaI family penicillinase repressor
LSIYKPLGNIVVSEPEIPSAELDVMRCLWQGAPRTAREIREELHTERPLSHSSVCTLLGRLEAKGFVVREKGTNGKAFVYRAARPPNRTKRRLVADLLDRLFAGRGVDLVAALFESKPPTDEQLDDLQALLNILRLRRRRGEKGTDRAADR